MFSTTHHILNIALIYTRISPCIHPYTTILAYKTQNKTMLFQYYSITLNYMISMIISWMV